MKKMAVLNDYQLIHIQNKYRCKIRRLEFIKTYET